MYFLRLFFDKYLADAKDKMANKNGQAENTVPITVFE